MPAGCETAVDLAAGTGLFTRPLAALVHHVIAVEPDPGMRTVLAARSPTVEVIEGVAEAIPLPDASVDAVFISSAWHWMDPDRATVEIARVLRDGGRFGVLWTGRDREVEWIRDLDRGPETAAWQPADEERHRRRRDLGTPDTALFRNVDRSAFRYVRPMALDDLVAMVATYSGVITASQDERDAVLALARKKITTRFPGKAVIDVPIRSWCWRADRTPR